MNGLDMVAIGASIILIALAGRALWNWAENARVDATRHPYDDFAEGTLTLGEARRILGHPADVTPRSYVSDVWQAVGDEVERDVFG